MTSPITTPENAWDERNAVEIRRYALAGDIDHAAPAGYEFEVPAGSGGGLDITALYIPKASKTLIVSFHGSLQRSKFTLPRFEWRKSLAPFDAAQLFVADWPLHLDKSMALAWYIGNSEQDFSADVACLIKDIATVAGYERILLTGSSGGGFAALAISRQIDGSAAVCFSPQTRVGDYANSVVKRFYRTAFPDMRSYGEAEERTVHGSICGISTRTRPATTSFATFRTRGTRTTTASTTPPSRRSVELIRCSVDSIQRDESNWCPKASRKATSHHPEGGSKATFWRRTHGFSALIWGA